jgi:hypothetical protein
MVHLSVAVRYSELYGDIADPGAFLLGNIAPDSIHMRAGTAREDKKRTHLHPEPVEDYLTRLREHYVTYARAAQGAGWRCLVDGYFSHLLTDYYWSQEVHPRLVEGGRLMEMTQEQTRALYYRETDQIDFHIFRQAPWREQVWELLKGEPGADFGGLLTAEEMIQWRERTFRFFENSAKEPGIVPRYITVDVVEEFVDRTARRVTALFKEWE